MSIKELMTYYGFTFKKKCSCDDGIMKEVYKKDAFTFTWRKYKGTFRIKNGKENITGWTMVQLAEKTLNEIFKENIPAQAPDTITG